MKYRYSHLGDDEEIPINPDDQDYGEDDSFDPCDCDEAALDYELLHFRKDSRY
ncbi:hypothetical protein [Gallibacterium genomosp. 3]|uniref:hypothetical protein n=1 Tax=Gallibacterium genomosp. 3 TaxID=505345 RepID=UPI0012E77173|nr:hypothetical protein [Gallibacterium genomosp. 3]